MWGENMFNFIDVIGIIVIVVCALISFKKGFVKTFFGFISTFLAIILAFALCNVGVSLIKENTEIDEWLETTFTSSLNYEDTENENMENPEEENTFLQGLDSLPENIQIFVGLEEYKESAKVTIVDSATEIILKILSWIIIYILVKIILSILCFVFNGIMNIPFLKQINNLTGLILGVLLGLFRIYVVLAFISFLVAVVPMEGLVNMIKSSLLVSVLYENNLLISLIF